MATQNSSGNKVVREIRTKIVAGINLEYDATDPGPRPIQFKPHAIYIDSERMNALLAMPTEPKGQGFELSNPRRRTGAPRWTFDGCDVFEVVGAKDVLTVLINTGKWL